MGVIVCCFVFENEKVQGKKRVVLHFFDYIEICCGMGKKMI